MTPEGESDNETSEREPRCENKTGDPFESGIQAGFESAHPRLNTADALDKLLNDPAQMRHLVPYIGNVLIGSIGLQVNRHSGCSIPNHRRECNTAKG